MANKLKGEVELVAGGETYTLIYTTNAIATVEELFGGKSIGEIMQGVASNPSLGDVRTLLFGALMTRHSDFDLLKVGPIMDDYDGPLSDIVEKIGRTIRFRLSRTPVDTPFEEPKPDD
jgi:hypothetical protein